MKPLKRRNPQPVMLSKRANVFYLEHVRVMQMDGRLVYATRDGSLDQFFNIPERNTAFILLGKGSSLTDAAARRLAESQVMVGFCGSGGSPLFMATDMVFMAPQSEYRPTEYMQRWVQLWFDEEKRVELGRQLLLSRLEYAQKHWGKNPALCKAGIQIPENLRDSFQEEINRSTTTQDLLLAEARWARALYGALARGFRFEFTREEGKGARASCADICNGFLDHGNYIAYGYASVALCGLGLSFSLPVLHGKTRRGALVFDIADMIKDALVMPLAFECASAGFSEKEFRDRLIEYCQEQEALNYLFELIIKLCKK